MNFHDSFLLVLVSISSHYLVEIDSARILGVFPNPTISHQKVFRAYTQALLNQGHELVVVTPSPIGPNGSSTKNLTEIDISFTYKKSKDHVNKYSSVFKRGVIMEVFPLFHAIYTGLVQLIVEALNHPEIKLIIAGKTKPFDLIVCEALIDYPLILAHILKVPVIQISSHLTYPETYAAMGAVSRHPVYHPHMYRIKFKMTLWEKIREVCNEIRFAYEFSQTDYYANKMLKSQFGIDAPSVSKLRKNVEMLLLNANPVMDSNRAVPPNVIYLGALHLQPVKELPQDLKQYLHNSTRGVVYVSFGTNVDPAMMSQEFLNVFSEAFEALPYDILWKYDGELAKKPKNLQAQKWFPQRDLLKHPNIKAFVTQGGLQSTDEAIDAGVPLVGIPMLADQWYNVNKYSELGIGISLDSYTVTSEELRQAVEDVVRDKKYRKNIAHLKILMNDRPNTPMQNAVWWTEYVIRHKGAKHLRTPSAGVSWSEYLMIDVFIFGIVLISVVSVLCALIYNTVKFVSYNMLAYDIKIKQS